MVSARHYRQQRLSTLRQLLCGAGILTLLLAVQLASPAHIDLWWQTFFETMHVPVFGIIATLLLWMTPARWHWQRRLAVTIAALLLLSIASEAAQIPIGRDASITDLVRDWLGAGAFLMMGVALSPGFPVPDGRGRLFFLAGVFLLVLALRPLFVVSVAYWERFQRLPALISFDSRHARLFYRLQSADLAFRPVTPVGESAAEIALQDGPWPGLIITDVWSDWTSYESLLLDIDNPGATDLPINIRVHDREHRRRNQQYSDRFNRKLVLEPGRQLITISLTDIKAAPANRDLDLEQVDGIVIFATREEAGRSLVLYGLWLQ